MAWYSTGKPGVSRGSLRASGMGSTRVRNGTESRAKAMSLERTNTRAYVSGCLPCTISSPSMRPRLSVQTVICQQRELGLGPIQRRSDLFEFESAKLC